MTPRILRILVVIIGGALAGGMSFAWWAAAGVPPTTTLESAVAATTTSSTTPAATTTTLAPSTTSSTAASTTTTEEPRGTLVIQGVGDVALDPTYIPALATNGWDYAWSGLDGLFLEDDLTVVNLECVPSDLGSPLPKSFVFRCPPDSLPSMAANGVEVANMGNNHSGDFGKEALVDGRMQLAAAGVSPVGAGKDLSEAGQAAIFEIHGWTVAVVGFGGVAPGPDWYATDDRPGMRSGDDTAQMVEAVAAADEMADLVVVTIHWGRELDTTPLHEDVERAQAMIDAGADIIFGHHQHRLNPLEMLDGAPVFWGLGNFVWPHNSTASATTAVARVVVRPDGTMEACMIPAFIESHGHPVIAAEPECGPVG